MAVIFKSSLQNLSPLPTSLKVEPLANPKTSLKFFVNITTARTPSCGENASIYFNTRYHLFIHNILHI